MLFAHAKPRKLNAFALSWKSLTFNEKEPLGNHLREDGVFQLATKSKGSLSGGI